MHRSRWEKLLSAVIHLGFCFAIFVVQQSSFASDLAPLGIVGVIQGKSKLFPGETLKFGSATRICLETLNWNKYDPTRDYWITPAHVLGNEAVEKISDTELLIDGKTVPITSAEMIDSAMDLVLFSTPIENSKAGPCATLAEKINVNSAYSAAAIPGGYFHSLELESPLPFENFKITRLRFSTALGSSIAVGRAGREDIGSLFVFRYPRGVYADKRIEKGVSGSALLGSVDSSGNLINSSSSQPTVAGMIIAFNSSDRERQSVYSSSLPAPAIMKRLNDFFTTGRTETSFSVKSLANGTGVRYEKTGAVNHNFSIHTGAGGEGGRFGVPPANAQASGITFPGSDRNWLSFENDWSEYETLPKKYLPLFDTPENLEGIYEEKSTLYFSNRSSKVQPWLNVIPESRLANYDPDGLMLLPADVNCTLFKMGGRAFKFNETLLTSTTVGMSDTSFEYCEQTQNDGSRTLWLRLNSEEGNKFGVDGLILRVEVKVVPETCTTDLAAPCPLKVDARYFLNKPNPVAPKSFRGLRDKPALYRWVDTWKEFNSLDLKEGIQLNRKGLRGFYDNRFSFVLSHGYGLMFTMQADKPEEFSIDLSGPVLQTPIPKTFSAYE